LCGAVFPATTPPGPADVWPARGGKIHRHTCLVPQLSPSPNGIFLTSTLIWWGLLSTVIILIIFLLLLIVRRNEWRPSPFQKRAACAKAFTFTWISRFAVPETFTSDRWPQLTSSLWLQLCEMLNISHKQTTAYHPELNGAVERTPRTQTLVFLQLRQFSVHKLSCQMNFFKMLNFQLTPLSTKIS
jgi:magnesium-transporting ATPase (P-type)